MTDQSNNQPTKHAYTVLDPIQHNGDLYPPNDREIELTDDQAQPLLAVGAIELALPAPESDPFTSDARRIAIRAAIEQLDKNDPVHWTADSKPNTTSIGRAMDAVVSAEERDAVWAEMLADA